MPSELEVVWPLHKWHYLNPDLIDMHADIPVDETSESMPATSRELAARALLAGADCTQERVAALLDTSRRSVGRTANADVLAALQDATVVAEARTLLVGSASYGSTAEEREAADAWLTRVLRDECQVEQGHRRRHRHRKAVVMKPTDASKNGRHRPAPRWSPTTLAALQREQRRIRHRAALLEYVLTDEVRQGVERTLSEALSDHVAAISEAARTIGTILRPSRR
jgi:hypothetical protein